MNHIPPIHACPSKILFWSLLPRLWKPSVMTRCGAPGCQVIIVLVLSAWSTGMGQPVLNGVKRAFPSLLCILIRYPSLFIAQISALPPLMACGPVGVIVVGATIATCPSVLHRSEAACLQALAALSTSEQAIPFFQNAAEELVVLYCWRLLTPHPEALVFQS